MAARATQRKIMLVDDHPVTRMGLVSLINAQPGLQITAEASGCDEALNRLPQARPDMAIVDLSMPGRGGLEFIRDALAMVPGLPILVLSLHDEMYQAEKALRAGALGYVMKDAGTERIIEAVRRVGSGEIYLSSQMSARILELCSTRGWQRSSSPVENLTEREFQIFQLLGRGLTSKRIASRLRLSHKTVDAHREHMKQKLKLPNGAALLRHAANWVKTQGDDDSGRAAKRSGDGGGRSSIQLSQPPHPA